MVARLDVCEESLIETYQALQKLGNNDNVIVNQMDQMEVQITCLVRIMILNINAMRDAMNMPPMTFEDMEDTFKEFADFRKRPDFKQHMKAWYSGEDLSELPEPEDPTENPVPMPHPEGDVVESHLDIEEFGGDYDGAIERNEIPEDPSRPISEGEERGVEAEVPEMRDDNQTADRPQDGQEPAGVPEVRDQSSDGTYVGSKT